MSKTVGRPQTQNQQQQQDPQLVDPEGITAALAVLDGQSADIERVETAAVALLNKSEVEAQLSAAHQYPRSIKRFMAEALTLATLNQKIAEACIYTVPRDGKQISGPSVRMAEICASAYGNLHVGARVVEEGDRTVTSQGIAWDLEKNLRVTVESKRRITTKQGKRFSDDMVVTTGNAAASVALRNAVFRVVPRAYVDLIYAQVRKVAVGDASTLASRRAEVVLRLNKIGVTTDRILAKLGRHAIDDVGLEDLEILIGLGTSIKNDDQALDDAFPPVMTSQTTQQSPPTPPASSPAKPGSDGELPL